MFLFVLIIVFTKKLELNREEPTTPNRIIKTQFLKCFHALTHYRNVGVNTYENKYIDASDSMLIPERALAICFIFFLVLYIIFKFYTSFKHFSNLEAIIMKVHPITGLSP